MYIGPCKLLVRIIKEIMSPSQKNFREKKKKFFSVSILLNCVLYIGEKIIVFENHISFPISVLCKKFGLIILGFTFFWNIYFIQIIIRSAACVIFKGLIQNFIYHLCIFEKNILNFLYIA